MSRRRVTHLYTYYIGREKNQAIQIKLRVAISIYNNVVSQEIDIRKSLKKLNVN